MKVLIFSSFIRQAFRATVLLQPYKSIKSQNTQPLAINDTLKMQVSSHLVLWCTGMGGWDSQDLCVCRNERETGELNFQKPSRLFKS